MFPRGSVEGNWKNKERDQELGSVVRMKRKNGKSFKFNLHLLYEPRGYCLGSLTPTPLSLSLFYGNKLHFKMQALI
jgi:hypothetical protein